MPKKKLPRRLVANEGFVGSDPCELHDGGASQDFNGITGSCFAKLIFAW